MPLKSGDRTVGCTLGPSYSITRGGTWPGMFLQKRLPSKSTQSPQCPNRRRKSPLLVPLSQKERPSQGFRDSRVRRKPLLSYGLWAKMRIQIL